MKEETQSKKEKKRTKTVAKAETENEGLKDTKERTDNTKNKQQER